MFSNWVFGIEPEVDWETFVFVPTPILIWDEDTRGVALVWGNFGLGFIWRKSVLC